VRPLRIVRLAVRGIRNIASLDVELGPHFNVIHGDNGQGKTNLLEAIYLVATSKSFRAARSAELLSRHPAADQASVRAEIDEDGVRREQSVGLQGGLRVLRIDGSRPRSSAVYAARTPIVVFSPSSLSLSMGSSGERRTLLDRVALYESPVSLEELGAYQRALRERQRALEDRGERAGDLQEWEELVVRHGLEVMRARAAAAEGVIEAARTAFSRIAPAGLELEARYAPSAPRDADAYRAGLRADRAKDLRRGSASVGPHRDDLELSVGGMPARATASQGQHRALVLALKAAELAVIGRARDAHPILLLDDVSSELDADRTAALFAFLSSQRGQVFLTTTRPELIPRHLGQHELGSGDSTRDRVDFRIVAGRLSS